MPARGLGGREEVARNRECLGGRGLGFGRSWLCLSGRRGGAGAGGGLGLLFQLGVLCLGLASSSSCAKGGHEAGRGRGFAAVPWRRTPRNSGEEVAVLLQGLANLSREQKKEEETASSTPSRADTLQADYYDAQQVTKISNPKSKLMQGPLGSLQHNGGRPVGVTEMLEDANVHQPEREEPGKTKSGSERGQEVGKLFVWIFLPLLIRRVPWNHPAWILLG